MKKTILLCLVCLHVLSTTSAQTETPAAPKTKADYLEKSRQLKTAGFVFLGLGAIAIGIAAPGNVDFDALPVLVIGGGACIVSSIVLFIASSRNKKKANQMTVGIKIENGHYAGLSKSYPALAFRIGL